MIYVCAGGSSYCQRAGKESTVKVKIFGGGDFMFNPLFNNEGFFPVTGSTINSSFYYNENLYALKVCLCEIILNESLSE